mmetsp:Transcript_2072/g.4892  ORF Transcript_2072/g.4892 Transcript_2072/m.4892 type:complete len:225 (+) Transcript_2072:294-968(+)
MQIVFHVVGVVLLLGLELRFFLLAFLFGFLLVDTNQTLGRIFNDRETGRQRPHLDVSYLKGRPVRMNLGEGRAAKGRAGTAASLEQVAFQRQSKAVSSSHHQSISITELDIGIFKRIRKDTELFAFLAATFGSRPQKALPTAVPFLVRSPPGLCQKCPKDFSVEGLDSQYGANVAACLRGVLVHHFEQTVEGGTVAYQAVLQPKRVSPFAIGQMLLEISHQRLR